MPDGPHIIYVKTPVQLVQVIEQEPGAFGFAQLALTKQRGLPELTTEAPIEQVLSLVTFGDPTPAMKTVIDCLAPGRREIDVVRMERGWKRASAALRVVNGGISAKLYCFAFLSLLAVATLSISSIYFSPTTETAAQRLYGVGFVGILNATRLDLLLERHRRIVESTPSEVDRDRLQSGRNELGQIRPDSSALMIEIAPASGDSASLESRISASLPPLFEAADQVAFYANEFAQDKAVEEANGYAHIANAWSG